MAPQTPTTSTPTTTTPIQYKSDIMHRLGGESVFEFIVLAMVEQLQKDERLQHFFDNYGSDHLSSLHKTILTAMLTQYDDDKDDYDVDGFILLRYYRVIEQGFNETHFDILVQHFMEALQDAWVEDDVLQDAVRIVKSFRPIYVVNGNSSSSEKSEEDDIPITVKSSSKTAAAAAAATKAASGRRGSSGEFLLNLMRPRGAKRTKQRQAAGQ